MSSSKNSRSYELHLLGNKTVDKITSVGKTKIKEKKDEIDLRLF